MKHELKITVEFEVNGSKTHSCPLIRVFVDENVIGCIQDLKLHASAQEFIPEIEFSFLDLEKFDFGDDEPSTFVPKIKNHIALLSQVPYIKINMIDPNIPALITQMEEVGTNGIIEYFPEKKTS